MIYKPPVTCLWPTSPASPPISLHLTAFAPDLADHSQFPACALVIQTSAPWETLSLLPVIQPNLQTQPRDSFILQNVAQLALALGSLPGTVRPLLLEVVDPSMLHASLYLKESFNNIYHATLFPSVYGPEPINERYLIYLYIDSIEHRSRHTKEVQCKYFRWY